MGGAVRDALLGIQTLDWDIATSARPDQVQRLFKRTVPVGVEFGTVGVLDVNGVLHEVTTFRHDVETDGRHAVVKFGASLEEDLARRDFTINAIAVHAERLEMRDPFGGRDDLERRVIRCVGEASERMREDRLRALRALRFAGRFEFAIEPATWTAIMESAPHLGRLSMERVKQELEKVMEQIARPSATLARYREAGIFAALVPALADAPAARFAAIDYLARPGLVRRPDRRTLRLAALFVEPGVAPARALESTLKALKFSNLEARAAVALAESAAACDLTHLRAMAQRAAAGAHAVGDAIGDAIGDAGAHAVGVHQKGEPGPAASADAEALRRLIARAGRLMVPGLTRLLWARAKADGLPASEGPAGIALYRRALRCAFRDPLTVADLAIDGEDLRQHGVPPGPQMGTMLAALLERVLVDPSQNTRDTLIHAVHEMRGQ